MQRNKAGVVGHEPGWMNKATSKPDRVLGLAKHLLRESGEWNIACREQDNLFYALVQRLEGIKANGPA